MLSRPDNVTWIKCRYDGLLYIVNLKYDGYILDYVVNCSSFPRWAYSEDTLLLLFQVFGLILSYVVVLFKFALVATADRGEAPTMTTAIFRNVTEYADDYR